MGYLETNVVCLVSYRVQNSLKNIHFCFKNITSLKSGCFGLLCDAGFRFCNETFQ